MLEITEPGYQDFRSDASCIVRPQNLIGERFVECKPTQPRSSNAEPPPELREIDDGPGEGQHLLPVENTMQTVDIDLIGNTMREPERERLSLILNELGTGAGGPRRDLNEVIRRANPALQETDKVLEILAEQNTQLEQLAVNSDTVLAPLARDRERVASAIRNSSEVAKATAEKRDGARGRHRDAAARSWTSSSRRWSGSARWPTSRRRCSTDLGAERARDQQRWSAASARSRRPRSRPSTRSARRRRPARRP